jgi:hypothetical protein
MAHTFCICTISGAAGTITAMKIAKPMLLVSTPIGVLGGLYEAYRLAGGLVILAAAMVGLLSAAAATVVSTVRREAATERAARVRKAATNGGEALYE